MFQNVTINCNAHRDVGQTFPSCVSSLDYITLSSPQETAATSAFYEINSREKKTHLSISDIYGSKCSSLVGLHVRYVQSF